MSAKKTKKSSRKIKSLASKKMSAEDSHRVKGGYIGETEKRLPGSRDGTSNT